MKVNYPELGWPHQQTKWYNDGDTFQHPSGRLYRRVGGKWVLALLLLLVLPTLAFAQQPAPPGHPSFTIGAFTSTGTTVTITWTPSPTPGVTHQVAGGYGDGSAFFSATATSPHTRVVPFHSTGTAQLFWTCVSAVTSTGVQSGVSCNSVTLPAKPADPLPPPPPPPPPLGTPVPFSALEPTGLTDLASIRVYYRVGTGAESSVTVPATSRNGGRAVSGVVGVVETSGTLTLTATALDTAGNESTRSAPATLFLGSGPAGKAGISFQIIDE